MARYDGKANLESRANNLYEYGHDSSVWGFKAHPPKKGHVVEIIGPHCVTRPCWVRVVKAADQIDHIDMAFGDLVWWLEDERIATVHQFFFSDFDTAYRIAYAVQQSARNIRQKTLRRIRLEEAGGFHTRWVLDRLFEIQHGRCYYSGELLTKQPKNYAVDHIHPIYQGGSDWPANLALVLTEINMWKGGTVSAEATLLWLARERGETWLQAQKAFCMEVDRQRAKLDQEFRRNYQQT